MTQEGKAIEGDAADVKALESRSDDEVRSLMFLILEGDHQNRNDLAGERVKDLRQMRATRIWAFRWFLVPFALTFWTMLMALGAAIYFPGIWCGESPLNILAPDDNGELAWPLAIFISGTFLGAITVFGATAVGVFASSRNKADGDALSPATDMLNKATGKEKE